MSVAKPWPFLPVHPISTERQQKKPKCENELKFATIPSTESRNMLCVRETKTLMEDEAADLTSVNSSGKDQFIAHFYVFASINFMLGT